MKLTVLGCSGSLPGPQSPASGYLVEHEGYRVILDLGNGAFGALQGVADPTAIDAVVVSHLHADHCIDFTAYLVALRYGPNRPTRRIPVIGPSGIRGRLESAYDPMARESGMHEVFTFATPATGQLGPFEVSYAEMNHPVRTYATRLSVGGRTLVYSADTGESPELVTLADGADTFLCEATFGVGEPYVPDLHLDGTQAGQHAAQAGVDRLLITHVPPWGSPQRQVEQAAAAFDGTVEAAAAGAVYDV